MLSLLKPFSRFGSPQNQLLIRSFSHSANRQSVTRDSFKVRASTILNIRPLSENNSGTTLSHSDIQDLVRKTEKQSGFQADSLFLVATPNHAAALTNFVESFNPSKQVIGAVVDSLAYGSQRDGLSMLLFGTNEEASNEKKALIEIKEAIKIESEEERLSNVLGQPSVRGVRTARNPWTLSESYLSISLPSSGSKDSTVSIPLANTLFNTGIQTTLLYNTAGNSSKESSTASIPSPESAASTLLSSLHVKLPVFKTDSSIKSTGVTTPISSLVTTKSAAPLIELSTGERHKVSDAKSNMLKKIDGKPAAGFLEASVTLMSGSQRPASSRTSERKVFAAVTSPQDSKTSRFQVIAGGGGSWSPRASMLVLDPHAVPKPGDEIEFFLSESSDIYDEGAYQKFLENNQVDINNNSNTPRSDNEVKIVMECSPVLENVDDFNGKSGLVDYPENTVIEGLFTLGSEQGFLIEDVKYSVPGEIVEIEN